MALNKNLSKDEIFEKTSKINNVPKLSLDAEYAAMKNELNTVSTIKNNYIIVLFTGLIAFWGYVLSCDKEIVAYVMLLPMLFIYVIQVKLVSLTDLHVRLQAHIWVIYDAIYETNYISVASKLYGLERQSFLYRIRRIPAYYMGIANVAIVALLTYQEYIINRSLFACKTWIIVLVMDMFILGIIIVKFWDSRNGMSVLIKYAEKLVDDEQFEELRDKKMRHDDNDSQSCDSCEKNDEFIDDEE